MNKQSGQHGQGLGAIIDMIRMGAIVILGLHVYFYNYSAFREWGMTARIGDNLLSNIARAGLFRYFLFSKILALVFLTISLFGSRGKKEPDLTSGHCFQIIGAGLLLYFGSELLIDLDAADTTIAFWYILVTGAGFLLLLNGGAKLSRIVAHRFKADIFNRSNQTFPQQEGLVENEYSIHLPAEYQLKDRIHKSWINIINPFRGTLVLGSPGSGKTYFVIQHIIKQQIEKGFAMLVYDFKYDDLSRIAFNHFLKHRDAYPKQAAFYNINFDDLSRSHRCNPLAPSTMRDTTDAMESSRTILLGLNMDWISKQGDFFVESAVQFVTALIWFLRNYAGGKYCDWPHVIELAQIPYKDLFSVLRSDLQIQVFINPFINAFMNGAMEQLEGQIATATISLAKLSSPGLYYVLTGDDLTLDLNSPDFPKILTLGNNPQKTGTYGPILSVYLNTINRLANRKRMHPFAEILDEFGTIIANTMDKTIATGRSNRIAVTLSVQDTSQLRLAYGREFSEVIVNTCGNIISGQVTGETAKLLSERFGKTMQDRESISINAADVNITQSQQLEQPIPPSRIAALSSGEFVGMVADNPDQPIDLKTFCARIINDHAALAAEQAAYKDLPIVRDVTEKLLMDNYLQVKRDIALMIKSELARMKADERLRQLVIVRGKTDK